MAEWLHPDAASIGIEAVAETGSTNTDLMGRVRELRGPLFLVAERQTHGRGRAGRVWHADAGATLTFSLAWKFRLPVQALAGLSLATGVAVAQTLEENGVHVGLKWPNDILREGRKLGGILIETASAADGVWAVIGIGLNLALSDELEVRIGQPAADMRWLAQMDRHRLLAGLLNGMAQAMREFEQGGMAMFAERWNRLHAHAGKPVTIAESGRVLHEGVAVGVDSLGRLLLDVPEGRLAIATGDVSLRLSEGGMNAVAD